MKEHNLKSNLCLSWDPVSNKKEEELWNNRSIILIYLHLPLNLWKPDMHLLQFPELCWVTPDFPIRFVLFTSFKAMDSRCIWTIQFSSNPNSSSLCVLFSSSKHSKILEQTISGNNNTGAPKNRIPSFRVKVKRFDSVAYGLIRLYMWKRIGSG